MTGTRQTVLGGRHRAGAAAPPPGERPPRLTKRTGRVLLAGGLAVASATGGIVIAETASAAVPSFPDNVVVFPDRDFVTIEGYQDHVGEVATVEVNRPGVGVIGSAKGTVERGDVAFEINHPGGYCWGAGTGLNVTPDIQAKDVVSIKFTDGTSGETTTAGAAVTGDATVSGSTVTVNGNISGANPAQMEQRIVNPDLVDLVGKRDVRAVFGPMTPAPKGGYSSGLVNNGDGTFTATYVFDDPAAAEAAANSDLGERAMSWQVEDADGNRQGLTIAEYGEAGGPGMGGCPAGASSVPGAQGSMGVVKNGSTMTVKWSPAVAPNGTAPVTGYQVDAVDTATGAIIGQRTDAKASQAVLTVGATANYTVEARSLTGAKMSDPFPTGSGTSTPVDLGDTTPPTLTLTPAASPTVLTTATLAVKSSEAGEIYYSTGTDQVINGGLPSDAAQLYTAPLPVTGPQTYHFVSFDAAGNFSDEVTQAVDVPAASTTAPATAPTGVVATGGQLSAQVRWQPVTDATSYQVGVYKLDANGANPVKEATQPAPSTSPTTVSNLVAGKYAFTVTALNGTAAGPESAQTTAVTVTPVTDTVTIATAKWKTGDFRVTGSGTTNGATVKVYRANADGTKGAQIGTLSVGVTLNAYDWRLRTGVPTTNPSRIVVESSGGGISAPFTVTNG